MCDTKDNIVEPAESSSPLEKRLSAEQHDYQTETRSILEALEVSNDSDSPHEKIELEKGGSVAPSSAYQPATQAPNVQDWDGPDDPENPYNWSLFKRCMHVFPIAFLALAVTAASSIITPATPEIASYFHVSRTAAILSLSLFVVGLGIGPTIAAPISETYGRSIVYKGSAPIFMLFILGAGFSKNFGGFLVCRLLAGMAGGPVLAVGAGTNADLFPVHIRAISSALYIMAPFLGPAAGPVIGGFVAQYKGWRWTQWCTIFIAIPALGLVLSMQETYKKVILKKRAKRLGIASPGVQLSRMAYIKLLLTITLIRPVHMLVTEPIVLFFSLYSAFTFGVLFAFFAAYPFTFESVYGFSTWQYGLTFLGIGAGVVLAAGTAILIDRKVYMVKYKQALAEGKTVIAPEHRLYAGMLGAAGVPVGLFWFAWSARADIHWISPVLAGIPFAWGNTCVFICTATYLIDVYGPLNGASAMAANGLARYILGAAFPLFTFQMFSRLGIGWATSLLGWISVALLPIPWVFFKYGSKIRAKSSYDTIKA